MVSVPSQYTRAGNTDHKGQRHDMSQKNVAYGTAGFRMNASQLPYIVYRMGALAAMRSQSHDGKATGLMITASHNAEHDNGVKVIEPLGEMLVAQWERAATGLANASDADYVNTLQAIRARLASDVDTVRPQVHLGHDTRESCAHLMQAAVQGIRSIAPEAQIVEHGLVSTPLLHYIVRATNDNAFGEASTQGYYRKLASNFMQLLKFRRSEGETSEIITLHVDCANGVGAHCAQALLQAVEACQDASSPKWTLVLHNKGASSEDRLNEGCGADYVKINRNFPKGEVSVGERWASLDGDADRLIYFYRNDDGQFEMLDGDAMIVLLVDYIAPLVNTLNAPLKRIETVTLDDDDEEKNATDAGQTEKMSTKDQNTATTPQQPPVVDLSADDAPISEATTPPSPSLKLGVVQTAYANGASTAYLKEQLQVPVMMVPTGVKHLHKAAHENFDIGVYFEANGHGTVVFSKNAKERIAQAQSCGVDDVSEAACKLRYLSSLINETVGDALSDMLAVEAVLMLTKRVQLSDWRRMYRDLPSVQLKVKVPDRTKVQTNWDETRCIAPYGLQQDIDSLIADVGNKRARAFVRPSGTEDIVRVYAECNTEERASALAHNVEAAAFDV